MSVLIAGDRGWCHHWRRGMREGGDGGSGVVVVVVVGDMVHGGWHRHW